MNTQFDQPELFKAIDVWQRRGDAELVRYRCFQSVQSGKYSVQSLDHYQLPVDRTSVVDLDRQFLELLSEQSPMERSQAHDSLREAISDFVRSFENGATQGEATENEG